MSLRTGLRSIRELAYQLCRLITAFTPLIKRIYPDNTALHTALEAANIACATLVEEADNQLPIGD